MKRNSVLKMVNPILGICFINQVVTGLIHGMLSHDVYEILHEGGGIVFALLALIHVILNWNWIRTSYFRKAPTI